MVARVTAFSVFWEAKHGIRNQDFRCQFYKWAHGKYSYGTVWRMTSKYENTVSESNAPHSQSLDGLCDSPHKSRGSFRARGQVHSGWRVATAISCARWKGHYPASSAQQAPRPCWLGCSCFLFTLLRFFNNGDASDFSNYLSFWHRHDPSANPLVLIFWTRIFKNDKDYWYFFAFEKSVSDLFPPFKKMVAI